MAKEFKEIKSSSIDPPGGYSPFHQKIKDIAQNPPPPKKSLEDVHYTLKKTGEGYGGSTFEITGKYDKPGKNTIAGQDVDGGRYLWDRGPIGLQEGDIITNASDYETEVED